MSESIEPLTNKDISEKINECVSFLTQLADSPKVWVDLTEEERIALMKITGRISRPFREERRELTRTNKKSRRQKIVKKERQVRAATGIRSAREASIFEAPEKLLGVDAGALIDDFEIRS